MGEFNDMLIMKRFFLVVALVCAAVVAANAQVVSESEAPMVLKNGKLFLNGELLNSPEAIAGAIGEETYQNTWKPASSMRKGGIALISVGSAVAACGLAGYITSFCVEWPEAEVDPERYDKYNMAFTIAKVGCGVGIACLGAGIPLFCVANGRMKRVTESYNQQGLTVSTASGGLGLTYRF